MKTIRSEAMDRSTFWTLIEEARNAANDISDVAPALGERLTDLSAEQIVAFKRHQSQLMDEAYRWDLWAVAYIINGGCSDDGFAYFRAWLMANGRCRWDAAMRTPEAVGEWAQDEEANYEDMLFVADAAYEAKTGDRFPYDELPDRYPEEPAGEEWEEDELEELYPSLYGKYF